MATARHVTTISRRGVARERRCSRHEQAHVAGSGSACSSLLRHILRYPEYMTGPAAPQGDSLPRMYGRVRASEPVASPQHLTRKRAGTANRRPPFFPKPDRCPEAAPWRGTIGAATGHRRFQEGQHGTCRDTSEDGGAPGGPRIPRRPRGKLDRPLGGIGAAYTAIADLNTGDEAWSEDVLSASWSLVEDAFPDGGPVDEVISALEETHRTVVDWVVPPPSRQPSKPRRDA